jgi:hypothetical protein
VYRSDRPWGQATRGKTAHNRLRRVDNFILIYDPGLIRHRKGDWAQACFVDLGYGAEPWTTLESAARLRRLNPELPVLGVEIDPERVAAAQPYADELTQFRLGGFNLPLADHERACLIRAFNVLRQYDEEAVIRAQATLGGYLLPGGLLVEGTSDPHGQTWVANLLRRPGEGQGLQVEGLLFSTNFRPIFEPTMFQPVLPKNYIHRMVPGEPIYAFFEAWKGAYLEALPFKDFGPRRLFRESAKRLKARGYQVDARPRLLSRGYLLWRPRA